MIIIKYLLFFLLLSLIFLNSLKAVDKIEKINVSENNCTTSKELKTTRVYYPEDEYINTFPTKIKRDEYFDEFYKPLVHYENDYGEVQKIKLKKSYRSIAMMMKEEGFKLALFDSYDIGLFVYNNKRALVHVGSFLPKGVSACISVGYYLLELNGKDLMIRSFGWESGSVHPILEIKSISIEIKD